MQTCGHVIRHEFHVGDSLTLECIRPEGHYGYHESAYGYTWHQTYGQWYVAEPNAWAEPHKEPPKP